MFWHIPGKKNLKSFSFCYHNLIIFHQPAVILNYIDPMGQWEYAWRGYHCSKLFLLIMITEESSVYIADYISLVVYSLGVKGNEEKKTRFLSEIFD